MKMTLWHHHHQPPQTQCQQYLSCYDFDQTWKTGSCDHPEQIPTVMVTFVQATFVLTTFVHIRNISVVTDQIFWIQLFGGLNNRTKILFGPKFFFTKLFLTQKCLRPNIFWEPMFLDPTFFGQFEQRILLDQQIFYGPKFFLDIFFYWTTMLFN